eukprot:scaffold336_cov384-Prasinococcus_capsulatus_cf.AAC.19
MPTRSQQHRGVPSLRSWRRASCASARGCGAEGAPRSWSRRQGARRRRRRRSGVTRRSAAVTPPGLQAALVVPQTLRPTRGPASPLGWLRRCPLLLALLPAASSSAEHAPTPHRGAGNSILPRPRRRRPRSQPPRRGSGRNSLVRRMMISCSSHHDDEDAS